MSDDYAREDGTYDTAYQGHYGDPYPGGDGTTGGGMEDPPDERFAPDGIWQPLAPGGEFDAEATMNTPFTGRLPDFGAMPPGVDPLAAPGHGYVPDTSHTGQASYESAPQPASGEPWAPSGQLPIPAQDDGSGEHWSVPFAPEDPAEASGEYSVGQMVAPPVPGPPVEHEPPPAGQDPERAAEFGADPVADLLADPPPPDPLADPLSDPLADPLSDPQPDAGEPLDDGDPNSEHPTSSYVLTVNGTDRPVSDAWLGESLLYVLRERLGLAGAKDGCEQGECGACSVQVDGRLVASCLMPAATAAGCEVRTVEGLAVDGRPSDVQRALADCGAVQCGFCVPGLAMTVHDLLEGNHRPTELETRQALSGNLCRCSGYQGVLDAVREVITARGAAHDASHEAGEPGGDVPHIPHQSTGDSDGATS